jgi:hypothetical protein
LGLFGVNISAMGTLRTICERLVSTDSDLRFMGGNDLLAEMEKPAFFAEPQEQVEMTPEEGEDEDEDEIEGMRNLIPPYHASS